MNFVFYLHDEQSVESFEQKLLWFKERYNLVSYQDIVDSIYNGKVLKNACHLSVDDGWRSTYDIIFPVMKKHHVPFTIFVSPEITKSERNFWYYDVKLYDEIKLKDKLVADGLFKKRVEKFPIDLILKELPIDAIYQFLENFRTQNGLPLPERAFINENELKEMHQSGLVEVGAHTMIHPILSNETKERAEKEISESIRGLHNILNKEITAFAYPNGLRNIDFSEREFLILKSCGIKTAFSVNPGVINSSTNPLAIPRVGSVSRLRLGRLGLYLPSLANQAGIRSKIKSLMR